MFKAHLELKKILKDLRRAKKKYTKNFVFI